MTQNKHARVTLRTPIAPVNQRSQNTNIRIPISFISFLMHGKTEAQRGKVTCSGHAAS